jgi:hypothetical protein
METNDEHAEKFSLFSKEKLKIGNFGNLCTTPGA